MAEDIHRIIGEMELIPEEDGPQHILRVMYFIHRAHSSDKSQSKARAILMGCIDAVRECYDEFEPKYNQSFFK